MSAGLIAAGLQRVLAHALGIDKFVLLEKGISSALE